jgi:magnesium transporter
MLVNCTAYQEGRKLADISVDEIRDYLNRPSAFVWVALKDPEPSELDAVQAQFGLHPLAVEDARHGHQRPKVDEYGPSLFVVVQLLEIVDGELRLGEVAIFVSTNHVVSVRRNATQDFTNVRARSEQEPELLQHGPAYVLYALMDTVVDRYFPIVDSLEEEVEAIEERIFAGQTTRAHVEALYAMKRKLMILKHATDSLLEATSKLFGGRVPAICVGLQDYFRDVYDHLTRLGHEIDSLRDAVTTVISVNLSLITLQEHDITKRLAGYAALVAVPTMIAGIYGMNFDQMPELTWALGYPLAIGAMVVFDAYLFYRFRKAKWL